ERDRLLPRRPLPGPEPPAPHCASATGRACFRRRRRRRDGYSRAASDARAECPEATARARGLAAGQASPRPFCLWLPSPALLLARARDAAVAREVACADPEAVLRLSSRARRARRTTGPATRSAMRGCLRALHRERSVAPCRATPSRPRDGQLIPAGRVSGR